MTQLDLYRDDPRRIAAAWRVAADTALRDVQFTDDERASRAAYYLAEAERLEQAA